MNTFARCNIIEYMHIYSILMRRVNEHILSAYGSSHCWVQNGYIARCNSTEYVDTYTVLMHRENVHNSVLLQ